jgi:antitoxin component of RelBE/YafQ-DinJ toxin-antitoxin module
MANRRPNGVEPIPTRSIRVPDDRWNRAKAVAAKREETMSTVINDLLEKYATTNGRG